LFSIIVKLFLNLEDKKDIFEIYYGEGFKKGLTLAEIQGGRDLACCIPTYSTFIDEL
jgi:hypothetical protein